MDKTFNIIMLGGRRCGKSSVLASMLKCYKETVSDSKLKIEPLAGTEQLLDRKLNNLKNDLFSHTSESFTVDEKPTQEINSFSFQLSTTGVSENMILRFIDVPGERFNSNGLDDEADKEIDKIISESNVIIIAIDSVHLMEENGRFSRAYNKFDVITEWIKSSDFAASDYEKLVLFVPLKCETYYHSGRMDELNQKVKSEYADLFGFFSCSNLVNKFTVAITPILTVGNVIFDKFGKDENGKIILKTERGSEYLRPIYTYYKYTKPNATVEPKYCEQPFLYIMGFVLKFYNKHNPSHTKLGWAAKLIIGILMIMIFSPSLMIFGVKPFHDSVMSATFNIKRYGDGFELVQNPMGI